MGVRDVTSTAYQAALGRVPVEQNAARHSLLDALARRFGFRLYNRDLYWLDDPEFLELWSRFPAADSALAKDRRFVLWSTAKSLKDLDGDTVECGVYDGASSFLICQVLPGIHHVFDSFEGLSEPEVRDRPKDDRLRMWRSGDLAYDEAQVRANLASCDDVRFYRGWIPTRFEEVEHRSFRLVHIDVDLYQPTHDSIEFFWPRLVPGGVLLCDDYGSTLCPGAKRAMDELAAANHTSVIHLTSGQGLLVKR